MKINKYAFFCFTLGCLFQASLGISYDDRPRCFKSLEVSFFDETSLYQAFNFYNLPQGSWSLIFTNLNQQTRNVPAIMWAEGKKLGKNPLENPFDPKGAEKLLMQVLYRIFFNTLHNTLPIDDPSIEKMFNYIRRHKQPDIDACFREAEAWKNLRRPIEQHKQTT